ncbi:sugar phosphate isomerase/epimerase [Streptomyces sp. RB6PN25]|uniref:Sugar phosphate isomerase/epimerase n=1 Tax=Streptomyces humicola TaxID=2953240 RepID=A0ABT1PT45_9ACTN|nr:sugar phosphate isomerase/epimerase family protein [Streptomyces humicola]MCQ4080853.1 sugar phosphate isomerase/epimerase [Streptomyces humicola]
MSDLSRFSFNSETARHWPLPELIDAAARSGLGGVGLWREPVQETGIDRIARLVRAVGVVVTSLCRGGFFTAADAAARRDRIDDNRRAVEEAARLGARTLVLVCGGLPPGSRDLAGARRMVADAIAELAPFAGEHGVVLAIEPMHPMYCSDRSVISSLRQARLLAEQFPADQVGVLVDAYHVWWDPGLFDELALLGQRTAGFQVCDWITPLPAGVLTGRGMMGTGCIDLRTLRQAVERSGYRGLTEVEIFNAYLWELPGHEVLAQACRRYLAHVV